MQFATAKTFIYEKRKTHWKLFGSPEFQFSKVSGLPVDIQKNLQLRMKMRKMQFKKKQGQQFIRG